MRLLTSVAAGAATLLVHAAGYALAEPATPRRGWTTDSCLCLPLPLMDEWELIVLPHGRRGGGFLPPAARRRYARCETNAPVDEEPLPLLVPRTAPTRTGELIACAEIGSDGRVGWVRLVKGRGTPAADARALQALAGTLFRPARTGGRPVAARYLLAVMGPAPPPVPLQ